MSNRKRYLMLISAISLSTFITACVRSGMDDINEASTISSMRTLPGMNAEMDENYYPVPHEVRSSVRKSSPPSLLPPGSRIEKQATPTSNKKIPSDI